MDKKPNSFDEKIGWLGAILFALCGLPQAIQSIQDGHSNGISWVFLLMWLVGELLTLYYVWKKDSKLLPLLFNYVLNIIFVGIILFYKIIVLM